jgi:hypothetical protein
MGEGIAVPVMAGLAVGIAFILLFSTMVLSGRLPSTNASPLPGEYRHMDLSVHKLRESYMAGDHIDFSLSAGGLDSGCDADPEIAIVNSTKDTVWTYDPVRVMGCGDPDETSLHAIHASWNTSQLGSPLAIYKAGSYILRASYYGKTLEREFKIIENSKDSSSAFISPGNVPLQNCPIILVRDSVKVLNSTGFKVYNASGFENYVIEPGQKGTISFAITRGEPPTIIGNPDYDFYVPENDTFNNDAIFIHKKEVTVEQNITSWVVQSFGNRTDVTFYQVCHNLPANAGGGTECYSGPSDNPPPKTTIVTVTGFDHPGINATFDPKEEVLGFNESVIVKATFLVDPSAPRGTYWMELPPGRCNGSPIILFTVGSSPFRFSENDSVFIYPPASG